MIESIVHFAERKVILVENTRVSSAHVSQVLSIKTSRRRTMNDERNSNEREVFFSFIMIQLITLFNFDNNIWDISSTNEQNEII